MPEDFDIEQTLPSVVAALSGPDRKPCLVLTIAFHPDISRIGESAILPCQGNSQRWLLGRYRPEFGRFGQAAVAALDELHVSREALELVFSRKSLTLNRPPDSSRCRVAGLELRDSMEFDEQQLRNGIPLWLGHSVVLLLSLGAICDDDDAGAPSEATLAGSSLYMRALRAQVRRAASSELDVLVLGETGTGKELVAAAIHTESCRAAAPMVSVNMSAIPADLAASSLFGSARGAFTGAERAGIGYFQRAEGGTLFLDEIGDTPGDVQPQLLRALQQREIQAVGGPIRRVNLRVVSATDAALDIAGGDFKAALRHRLGACEIRLLPLRQHLEDMGELLLRFLTEELQGAGRAQLIPAAASAPAEIAAWAGLFHEFLCYHWPGNVRELRNFAAQVALASERNLSVPEHILDDLRKQPEGQVQANGEDERSLRNIRDVDEEEFARVHEVSRFEIADLARTLGVSRQAVYRRLEKTPGYRVAVQVPEAELAAALLAVAGDVEAAALALRVSAAGLRRRLRGSDLDWH